MKRLYPPLKVQPVSGHKLKQRSVTEQSAVAGSFHPTDPVPLQSPPLSEAFSPYCGNFRFPEIIKESAR
jgi:hypothetical protein